MNYPPLKTRGAAGGGSRRDSGQQAPSKHNSAAKFVVVVRKKPKPLTWGEYPTALEAEQLAARLRSFGWPAYVECRPRLSAPAPVVPTQPDLFEEQEK